MFTYEDVEAQKAQILKDLDAQVRAVRMGRAVLEEKKAAKQTKEEKFNKSPVITALNESITTLESQCKKEEAELRLLTLAAYHETGSKKPAPGVGIRIIKAVSFDPAEAKKWAISKGVCLSLDESAYKKALLSGVSDSMPGKIEEVAQATIAREL